MQFRYCSYIICSMKIYIRRGRRRSSISRTIAVLNYTLIHAYPRFVFSAHRTELVLYKLFYLLSRSRVYCFTFFHQNRTGISRLDSLLRLYRWLKLLCTIQLLLYYYILRPHSVWSKLQSYFYYRNNTNARRR